MQTTWFCVVSRRKFGLHGILYADDLVLCGESEEDVRAMVGSFVGVFEEERFGYQASKMNGPG